MTSKALILAMVLGLHTQYPVATLQDVYKTCYQDHFGAEHMAPDSATAAAYLDAELTTLNSQLSTLNYEVEPCGYLHRNQRIPLQMVLSGQISRDSLLHAFLEASNSGHSRQSSWYREWARITRVATKAVPAWRNDSLQALLKQAARTASPVHHSDSYREAYNPHYRIVPIK